MNYQDIWNKHFYGKTTAIDKFGREMILSKYGQTETTGGWEVDHIWPENASNGTRGSNNTENFQALNWESNKEKSNDLSGYANSKSFRIVEVKRDSENKIIGKMEVR